MGTLRRKAGPAGCGGESVAGMEAGTAESSTGGGSFGANARGVVAAGSHGVARARTVRGHAKGATFRGTPGRADRPLQGVPSRAAFGRGPRRINGALVGHAPEMRHQRKGVANGLASPLGANRARRGLAGSSARPSGRAAFGPCGLRAEDNVVSSIRACRPGPTVRTGARDEWVHRTELTGTAIDPPGEGRPNPRSTWTDRGSAQ